MFWSCLVLRAIITLELSVISASFSLYCVEAVFVSGFLGIDDTTFENVNSGVCWSYTFLASGYVSLWVTLIFMTSFSFFQVSQSLDLAT